MAGDIRIISRSTLPFIREVEQAGKVHVLGELRDFRWSDVLRSFMPDSSEFAVSWVQLAFGETLQAHTHPIQTMMVIHAGSGTMFGDLCRSITRDDVIVVPPGCEHGFTGGPDGLYALSIQFGDGFYTDPKRARVMFVDEETLPDLLAYNDQRSAEFLAHPIFQLLGDGALADPTRRTVFRKQMTGWLVRSGRLAEGHPCGADPGADLMLNAFAHWFSYRMRGLDRPERTTVSSLVLATASRLIVERAGGMLDGALDPEAPGHRPSAEDSRAIAVDLLKAEPPRSFGRLRTIVGQGWDVMTATADRVADLVREG
jgi:mannose-6-phosphate isomerase-like protein (cupin superfamily)